MRGNKNVIWKNHYGQEITFDNRKLYVESIDMTGTAGVHTVETLAQANGQVSLHHNLAAKTIPCRFAFRDVHGDHWLQEHLPGLFNPEAGAGTLTVLTDKHRYTIGCYPQDIPTFERDENVDDIWRFNADFVADSPLWRQDGKRTVAINSSTTAIRSECPFEVAPDIYLPASGALWIAINGKGLSVDDHEWPIIIKAATLDVIKAADGADCSYLIDAQYDIDSLRIRYGKNIVTYGVRSGDSPSGASLSYYNLSAGEV